MIKQRKYIVYFFIITFFIFFNTCKKAPTDAPEIITKITGRVTDGQTNIPLTGVQITTTPQTASVITGQDGVYTISDLIAGQYTIVAQKSGYNNASTTVTVTEGKTVNADIQLQPQGPELQVSPQTLDFDVAQTNLTFNITNKTGVGTVTWQISYNQSWLTISPSSGTTTTETDPISVTVFRDSVTFGNYSAVLTVTSDHGTKQINVLMTKQNPAAPQLTVSLTNIDFGASGNNQQVLIKNTGTGTLNWTATKSDSWILLSALNGSAVIGNPSTLEISINKDGLQPNNYHGTVTINSNGGNQTIIIKMQVAEGTLIAPTLQLVGTPTTNSIQVGWTKVNDPKFASYKLYRSLTNGVNENSTLVTTISNANTNLYTDNGLSSGTKYYYKVYVYSNTGIGSGSNEIDASTKKVLGNWVVTTTIPGVLDYLTPNSLYPLSNTDVWFAFKNEIWHYDSNSWSKNFTTSSTDDRFSTVWAIDQNNVWAAGSYYDDSYQVYRGFLYYYNGITWTKITNNVIGTLQLFDIVATSVNDLWVSGTNGALYHFNGTDWTKYLLSISDIVDLDILSSNDIWALGKDGGVCNYNGIGWIYKGDANNSSYNIAIQAISSTDVWIANTRYQYSGLWHYDGTSFSGTYKLPQGSTQYNPRFTIEMISSNEGWSVIYGDFVYTAHLSYYDGNEWQDLNSPTSNGPFCIKMLNSKSGWAVGAGGRILRYTE